MLCNFFKKLKASYFLLLLLLVGAGICFECGVAYGQFAAPPKRVMVRVKPGIAPVALGAKGFGASRFVFPSMVAASSQAFSTAKTNVKGVSIRQDAFLSSFFEIELRPNVSIQSAIERIEELDWVEYAEPVEEMELLYQPEQEPLLNSHWGHFNSKIFEGWDYERGDTSIVIGIIDSGCQTTHPGLRPNFKYNYRERSGLRGVDDDGNGFVDDSLGYDFGENDADVRDVIGHGTGVAGVAGAVVNDNYGTFGTGFMCKIMPIKVATADGRIVNTLQAMLYAAQNGCSILNLSLGRAGIGLRFEQEFINYLVTTYDVLIVAAAGNTPLNLDFYPASYENVLSVAHSTSSDARFSGATFSNFVDIMAPGAGVPATTVNSGHANLTGSSFASPFVAGAAGILRSFYPTLTAPQVKALIRASADDVYQVPENTPYLEKLGKGRLNLVRAINELNEWPAIRMSTYSLESIFQDHVVRNDTLRMKATFVNYLRGTTQDCQITLTSFSDKVKVINGTFRPGSIPSLDSVNNFDSPFSLYIDPSLGPSQYVLMRLGFRDQGYRNFEDYQYFYLTTDANFEVRFGNIVLNIPTNGRIGHPRQYDSLQVGMVWNGKQVLQQGGLVLGVSPDTISDAGIDVVRRLANQWANYIYNTPSYGPNGLNITNHIYEANNPLINAIVKQTFSQGSSPDYLVIDYELQNNRAVPIDRLKLGVFADFGVGDSTATLVWDSEMKFAYSQQAGWVVGMKWLDESALAIGYDLKHPANGFANLSDGFSNEEKYQSLFASNLSLGQGVGDKCQMGVVSMPLGPAQKNSKKMVLAFANNVEELKEKLVEAFSAQQYQPYLSQVPVLPDTIETCFGVPMIVAPEGGENFRFYLTADAANPVFEGNAYTYTPVAQTQTIFVSGIDRLIESPRKAVVIKARELGYGFDLPDSVDLRKGGIVAPQMFLDEESDILTWSFGDGSPVVEGSSPTHQFTETGIYQVALHIRDRQLGCEKNINKTIVVYKSRKKVGETEVFFCENSEWRISRAEPFGVFADSTLTKPIYKGLSWVQASAPKDTVFYLGSTDSLDFSYESYRFRVSRPVAVFEAINELLLAENPLGRVAFTNLSTGGVSYAWDFGNGAKSGDFEPTVNFTQAGNYEVTLTVTNERGCQQTYTQSIRVLADCSSFGESGCFVLFPNPASSFIELDPQFQPTAAGQISIIDLQGKVWQSFAFDGLGAEEGLSIPLLGLPKGVYVLKATFGALVLTQRFEKMAD